MKKITLAVIIFSALGLHTSAFAAPAAITGAKITGGDTGICKVLGEDVQINLSKGISGAYDCIEASNAIKVGACHASGFRTGTLVCAAVGVDNDGAPTYNDPGCNENNVTETITLAAPRYRGYRASTTGGSVGAQLLTGSCTTTTVLELVAN